MSLGTPTGLHAWVLQRFSAVYLAIFSVYVFINIFTRHSSDYKAWLTWVSHPVNQVAIGLFVLCLLIHAWVGARDIILDYVKPFGFRMLKLGGLAFFLIALGLWAFKILLTVTAV